LTVIRRCLFRDPDEQYPNILTYERSLSITVYRTSFTIYSCIGSKHHSPHFIRIEYGSIVRGDVRKPKLIAKQTNAIPEEQRQRLFPNEVLHCPIGKVPMRFQKVLTEQLNDPTQDIFRCPGSVKANHHGHYCKVSHGRLENDSGIICLTIEK